MRVTPKISDRPADTRNNDDAAASPFKSWMTTEGRFTRQLPCHPERSEGTFSRPQRFLAALGMTKVRTSVGRPHLADLRIRRQRVLAVDEAPFLHVALAVLHAEAADIGAHGLLMVERSEGDHAEWRQHLEAAR